MRGWEEISRALTPGTAIKYQLRSPLLFLESFFFLMLPKVGWHPLLTGAGTPRPMPVLPCWLTVAGAAHQFPPATEREGDLSSHATHSRETERNLKCPGDAQPTCCIQRSFSKVTFLKTHQQFLYILFFCLNTCDKKRRLWMHNQDCRHFTSPTVKNYFSNWAFKKDSQFLLCTIKHLILPPLFVRSKFS